MSSYLLNLYAEYIMRNARLDESQTRPPSQTRLDESHLGIKTARRNINNLRYADDITVMAESEEELKSLLMRVKEKRKKSRLKTQYSEN